MIKRIGAKRWQLLHRLLYVIVPLGVLHYFWMKAGKHDTVLPIFFAIGVALLLLIRGDFIGSLKMYPPLIPILFLVTIIFLRTIKPNWITKTFLSNCCLLVLATIIINYAIKLIA